MALNINAGRPAIPLQSLGAVPQPPPRPIAVPNPPHAPTNGPAIPGPGSGRCSKWLPPDCWNFCVGLWALVVTIAVFAIALVLLKPQLLDHQLNSEDSILSGKSYNLSAWTAYKDFRDDCRSQNASLGTLSSECYDALSQPLPPPPILWTHSMKRFRMPSTHFKTDRVQTWGLFTIFWSGLGTICFGILTMYRPRFELAEQNSELYLGFLKKLRGFLLDLFAPELLLYGAIEDLRRATNLKRKMRNPGHHDWTLKHSFYSNMGGFFCEDERGTWVRCDICDDIVRAAVRESSMPSAAEIYDRSKSVPPTIVIVIFNILWSILTICGRFTQKLGILQLQIAIVIYGIVLMLTYAIWWQKPNHPDPWELSWSSVAGDRYAALKRLIQSRRLSLSPPNQTLWMLLLASTMISSAYGMSWNHAFPAKIEQTHWKASVLLPTTVATITAIYLRTAYRPKFLLGSGTQVERTIGMACLGLNWACRLFILCEGLIFWTHLNI